MNKNSKIIVLVFCILIIVLFALKVILKNTNSNLIKNYLLKNGFVEDIEDTLYAKRINDNEIYYFNIIDSTLTYDKTDYSNSITKTLTSKYDYSTEELSYKYRIYIYDTNVVLEGYYNKEDDSVTCTPVITYQFQIEQALGEICNKVRFDILDFKHETFKIINDNKVLEQIKKG